MFCPRCGYQQSTEQTRFCSGCGFQLAEISQFMATGGFGLQRVEQGISPRKKGLKRGLFLFLSTFLVVPLVALVHAALNMEPFLVAVTAVFTFMGGILRMIYALLFESGVPNEMALEEKVRKSVRNYLNKNPDEPALPGYQETPASAYVPPMNGHWRDTADFSRPGVTEETTSPLHQNPKF